VSKWYERVKLRVIPEDDPDSLAMFTAELYLPVFTESTADPDRCADCGYPAARHIPFPRCPG
jgi:hypothetical protein